MHEGIYLLDFAEFDPFAGRVVLNFRGHYPIQVQATLTVMSHLKAAVTESVASLSRSEQPPEDSTSIL
jgi:hypothetical protein